MIKTITFDFGGVLYDYDGEVLINEFVERSEKGPEELRELMNGSSLDHAHFRGEVKNPGMWPEFLTSRRNKNK